jgi:hypothetical protein
MKYIKHFTIAPKDFARMPKGTQAVYIVDWNDATRAEQMITSYFSRLNGRVKWEQYISINKLTGHTLKTLFATVVKQGKA